MVAPLSVGWSHQTEARAFQRCGGQDPTVRGGARLGYFQSLSSWLAASFFSKDLPTVPQWSVCLFRLFLFLGGDANFLELGPKCNIVFIELPALFLLPPQLLETIILL